MGGIVLSATGAFGAVATTFNPVADTYVSSGNASTSYGTSVRIQTNQSAGGNDHRWAYVRFDLSSIDFSQIANLELDLFNDTTLNTPTTIDVYGLVSGEAFDQSTLTYSNDPNADTTAAAFKASSAYDAAPLTSFTSSTGSSGTKNVAFNVTSGAIFDFINADSDKIVTFVLQQEMYPTGNVGQSWKSGDTGTATLRPALIATTPEPATLGLLGLGSLGLLNRRRRRQ